MPAGLPFSTTSPQERVEVVAVQEPPTTDAGGADTATGEEAVNLPLGDPKVLTRLSDRQPRAQARAVIDATSSQGLFDPQVHDSLNLSDELGGEQAGEVVHGVLVSYCSAAISRRSPIAACRR